MKNGIQSKTATPKHDKQLKIKIDEIRNHICSSKICGALTNTPIIMKFDMQKVETKIFKDDFQEIDLGT